MNNPIKCDARIRPFLNSPSIDCELDPFDHQHLVDAGLEHRGAIRDAAYPGSVMKVTWYESDRRTFRGEWADCPRACTLPAGHRGNHETP